MERNAGAFCKGARARPTDPMWSCSDGSGAHARAHTANSARARPTDQRRATYSDGGGDGGDGELRFLCSAMSGAMCCV